jgi:hypothetical protein
VLERSGGKSFRFRDLEDVPFVLNLVYMERGMQGVLTIARLR